MAWQRFFSFAPALISWTILIVLTVLSLAIPQVGAALIIAFLIFYIFRVTHNAIFLVISFLRVFAEEKSDWLSRLEDIAGIPLPKSDKKYLRGTHDPVWRAPAR